MTNLSLRCDIRCEGEPVIGHVPLSHGTVTWLEAKAERRGTSGQSANALNNVNVNVNIAPSAPML